MFYISLGVVGVLLAMICALVIVLAIVIKSPSRRVKDSNHPPTPAIHINPDPDTSTSYEPYTDNVTDGPSVPNIQTPGNTQHLFDDPIYNAPGPQKDLAECFKLAQLKTTLQPPTLNNTSLATPIISAYAISNVHCLTEPALPTVDELSHDYDYADI